MRTFLSKSTPSTSARKPCTKCCRACSPSLDDVEAGLFLAADGQERRVVLGFEAGAAPESVQGAHRTFGVASQAGLGRLPASVVSNISVPRSA